MSMLILLASFVVGIGLSSIIWKKIYISRLNEILEKKRDIDEKWSEFYVILNQWWLIKQNGHSLVEYFEKKSIKSVAVYGIKELGLHLVDELKYSGVSVSYIIDNNSEANNSIGEISIIKPEGKLPATDAVVVTAIHYYAEIEDMLSKNNNMRIINLQDVVYETLNDSID